jgi:hypothetical protein
MTSGRMHGAATIPPSLKIISKRELANSSERDMVERSLKMHVEMTYLGELESKWTISLALIEPWRFSFTRRKGGS